MGSEETILDAAGKGKTRTPDVSSPEESDGNIVPEKSANNGAATPAEAVEGREPPKRNSKQEAAVRAQSRCDASIGLLRVRQRAEKDKAASFDNLFQFLKVDLLRKSFYKLKRKAASGLDGVSWYNYEQTLEARLPELERELHLGSYSLGKTGVA